jgi:hypothetical protein
MHKNSLTKKEKEFRKTFEKMEGFSFVTPITGLNRPNTGKEDGDDSLTIEVICELFVSSKEVSKNLWTP